MEGTISFTRRTLPLPYIVVFSVLLHKRDLKDELKKEEEKFLDRYVRRVLAGHHVLWHQHMSCGGIMVPGCSSLVLGLYYCSFTTLMFFRVTTVCRVGSGLMWEVIFWTPFLRDNVR